VNAARTLNFFTHSSQYTVRNEIAEYDADGVHEKQPVAVIYYQRENALSVADACNALELFVLYAGFIICFPSSTKRKIVFTIGGILFIFLINVLRCAGLTWIFTFHPQYGDFSHHFLFTFIVYACIFLLWIWFSKKTGINARTQ